METNTHKLLDILDSHAFKPKATFFVLGWIAKRVPGLVQEIHNRGHEVASHGTDHHLCTNQPLKELSEDLSASKKLLEDLTGEGVYGYRAPSFAVNNEILDLIHQAGYRYDSSYNSFAMHDRYGSLDLTNFKQKGALFEMVHDFFELPITNLNIGERVFPLGGGGYFRLIPSLLFKKGMEWALGLNQAFVFYSHPWEYDPDQPRVELASPGFKFRHYINLRQTEKKIHALMNSFSELDYPTCSQYIKTVDKGSFIP